MKNHPIVCFAREAGGAEAIAPVVKIMQEREDVHLIAKDFALTVFARHGLGCQDISTHGTRADIDNLLEKISPSFIFTSATSLPWNDMTERYLWRWGRTHNVPTMGVIDQWQNYAIRFSGPDDAERLAYLPDFICTPDSYAKVQMIEEGIPEDRIIVTGQPAFDAILRYQQEFSEKGEEITKKLGIDKKKSRVIVFVSEALFRDFQHDLGYTEVDALGQLLDTLMQESRKDTSRRNSLIIKLHPQNIREDFASLDVEKYRQLFDIHWIGTELPPRDVVMIADVVIGMASVLLVESILLGKPTISFQPGTVRDANLIATKIGAIPLICNGADLERTLHLLLTSDEYRTEYLHTQTKLTTDGQASLRIAGRIGQILEKEIP